MHEQFQWSRQVDSVYCLIDYVICIAEKTGCLPSGWDWEGPWELETSGDVDKDGWTYGVDFGSLTYPPNPGNQNKALQHFVRRRRYFRRRRQLPQKTDTPASNAERAAEDGEGEVNRTILGVVQPGDSLPLPFGWRRSGKKHFWLLHVTA